MSELGIGPNDGWLEVRVWDEVDGWLYCCVVPWISFYFGGIYAT